MKYISILLILICLSSCEDFFDTIVDIEPPAHEPKLAMHAFGSNYNNGEVRLMLTKTYGILEDLQGDYVNNALITLQSEGVNYTFDNIIDEEIYDTIYLPDTTIIIFNYNYIFNLYSSDFRPEAGKKYTLTIESPGLPTIKAEQTFPHAVVPDSAIFIQNVGIGQSGEELSAIEIYFKDPAGIENFYEINVRRITTTNNFDQYIMTPEPGALIGDDMISLSDKVFDGQNKRFRITFTSRGSQKANDFIIFWKSISPETYAFNEAVIKYLESSGNPFLTPTQLYTNIENGVGIFSLSHSNIIVPR